MPNNVTVNKSKPLVNVARFTLMDPIKRNEINRYNNIKNSSYCNSMEPILIKYPELTRSAKAIASRNKNVENCSMSLHRIDWNNTNKRTIIDPGLSIFNDNSFEQFSISWLQARESI